MAGIVLQRLIIGRHYLKLWARHCKDSLRPQLLCSPASVVARCLAVPGVSEPPRLLGVAEIGLLDDVWHDNYETEVLPCNFIVEIVCF